MPPSLIEAARIDGASELYTFHRIAIPIMSPGIATMSIMGFIGGWIVYPPWFAVISVDALKVAIITGNVNFSFLFKIIIGNR